MSRRSRPCYHSPMRIRFFICYVSITVALAGASLWILSHKAKITYEYRNVHRGVRCLLVDGGLYIVKLPGGVPGYSDDIENPDTRPDLASAGFLGFNAGQLKGRDFFRLPFWFLTTFSLVPVWLQLFWRQLRP